MATPVLAVLPRLPGATHARAAKPLALVGRDHPALHHPALAVQLPAAVEVVQLALRMNETLMRQRRGLALAAPQVGVPLRLVVFRGNAYCNPSIILGAEFESDHEACLSLPGHTYRVDRATTCAVTGLSLDGIGFRQDVEGTIARAWQHELDHLDGVLISERWPEVRHPERPIPAPTVDEPADEAVPG